MPISILGEEKYLTTHHSLQSTQVLTPDYNSHSPNPLKACTQIHLEIDSAYSPPGNPLPIKPLKVPYTLHEKDHILYIIPHNESGSSAQPPEIHTIQLGATMDKLISKQNTTYATRSDPPYKPDETMLQKRHKNKTTVKDKGDKHAVKTSVNKAKHNIRGRYDTP